jgi:hypothetical protein
MADHWGYPLVFALSTIFGVASALAFWLWVRDPKPRTLAARSVPVPE